MRKLFFVLIGFTLSINLFISCSDDDTSGGGQGNTNLDPLTVSFASNLLEINENEEVSFQSIVNSTNVNYAWTFENATPSQSSDANPSIRFNAFGQQKVTLEVTRTEDNASLIVEESYFVYPSSDLTAYYPFDGNMQDRSGNNFNGAGSNLNLVSDRNDNEDSAYAFNGESFIETSTEIDNDFGNGVSISFWISLGEDGTTNRVLSTFNSQATGGDCADKNGFNVALTNDNGIRFSYASDGNDYIGRFTNSTIELNTWNHVVVIWNGELSNDGFSIYINNEKVDDSDFSDGTICDFEESNLPLNIGRTFCSSGPCAFLTGSLDDLRIYSKVLSQEEIEALNK